MNWAKFNYANILKKIRELSENEDYESITGLLNSRAEFFIEQSHNAKSKKKWDEIKTYFIKDEVYIEAISKAQRDLNTFELFPDLNNTVFSNYEDAHKELLSQMAICEQKPDENGFIDGEISLSPDKINAFEERIIQVVFDTVMRLNLTPGWEHYLEACIVSPNAKHNISVEPSAFDKVKIITTDKYSMTLRINKGISKHEFIALWDAFSVSLTNDIPAANFREDVLNNRIYSDKLRGMSYSELAEKYFHKLFEDKKDIDSKLQTIDRVKKIVRRQKQINNR